MKFTIPRANEGTIDREVRVIVGVALLSLVFVGPQTWWGLVGVVPLATGIFGYCHAYSILGINTISKPLKPAKHAV